MRKILNSFFREKIHPHSQRINDSKEKLAGITSRFADHLDYTALLKTSGSELEKLNAKISDLQDKILNYEVLDDDAAASSPSILQPIDDADEMPSKKAILQKELESYTELHKITTGRANYYKEQLSFPKKIADLESEIAAAQDALAMEAGELNKLLFEGEKKSFVISWTNKLGIFEPSNDSVIMHYLAHYNIMHLVLPSMLDNASVIVERELGRRENAHTAKGLILESLSILDKSGTPPIQQALANDSFESFDYILKLPGCKKGFFEVAKNGTNIFHLAILKGVFENLIPYIAGGLDQLRIDEDFTQPVGTIRDHVNLMLVSQNDKDYSPAKIAAYVASSKAFEYIHNSNVLKLDSGETEEQVETYTAARIISRTLASVKDLLDDSRERDYESKEAYPDEKDGESAGESHGGEIAVYKRIHTSTVTKEDSLLDYLFTGSRHLEVFIINLVNEGCSEIFDSILARQRITEDFGLAKYIIQITKHVREIRSLEADNPKINKILTIYRNIFKEYWPQITLADNNSKAHDQLKNLADKMDAEGAQVLGIPSDKLAAALELSAADIKRHNGDVFSAAQEKLMGEVTENYEVDLRSKALIRADARQSTPSPVKISLKKAVEATVNKAALRSMPHVLRNIDDIVETIESVRHLTMQDQLAETTGLDSSFRGIEASFCEDEEPVKIEISEHIKLIFTLILTLKDSPGNEDIREVYEQANPEPSIPVNVIKTILLLATGMRNSPNSFIDFVNDATCEANGVAVNLQDFIEEFIASIGIDELDAYGCVNFELEIAKIVIEALVAEKKLTCQHLEYAFKANNKPVIDYAIATGLLHWAELLELAFSTENFYVLEEKYLIQDIDGARETETAQNIVPALLEALTQESLKIYGDADDESLGHQSLGKKAEFFAILLSSKRVNSMQNITFTVDQLTMFKAVFDSFEDEGRSLDYSEITKTLTYIAEVLKPLLDANDDKKNFSVFSRK